MSWNDLSMAERAAFIQLGVENGVTSLSRIKDIYNSSINDKSLQPNKFGDGGILDTILGWFGAGSSEDNKNDRFTRVRMNDSPTKEYSTKLEDNVASRQKARIANSKKLGITSEDYYIPYAGEEIKIPGIGRVSSNTLDSIAVNAKRAGISFEEGLGLAALETNLGASPNMSTKGFKQSFSTINKRPPTDDEIKAFERASLNASFMRNYGGIYPQFLVNDHEWDDRGWEKSPQYKAKLSSIKSPLQHAFTMYKMGIYNTGDETHTSKVKAKGKKLMGTKAVKQWKNKYDNGGYKTPISNPVTPESQDPNSIK